MADEREMVTEIIKVDRKNIDIEKIAHAVELIKAGQLVAFPTETVYGLGGDALNLNAVKKIFQAKGRPSDNPLILHIGSKEMISGLVENISNDAKKLIECFWPGPITLIFKKADAVPYETSVGLDTVAIRFPSNIIAQKLITLSETPIAAPSANISGKTSTTTAQDVYEDFQGIIPLIIDGGKTEIGLESTVVDVSNEKINPQILRPGKITKENIEECLGYPIKQENRKETILRSPGMKYRHYAPNAKLILFERGKDVVNHLNHEQSGSTISLIISQTEFSRIESNEAILKINSALIYIYDNIQELGSNLFSTLRQMDRAKVDKILVQFNEEEGLGYSLLNRLKKAASLH